MAAKEKASHEKTTSQATIDIEESKKEITPEEEETEEEDEGGVEL